MKNLIKLISIMLGLLVPIVTFAQMTSTTPNPIYVAKDGKVYVKSNQPLYLWLSTSPEKNAPDFLLRSESSPKAGPAKPFSFEGHGTHTIKHMADHRIPQKRREDHVFYVHDDGRPPHIKVSVTKAPWVYNGNVNVYGKPVTISMQSKDEDSGTLATYFALNSTVFSTYQQPIILNQEADYSLKFYAVDNVGNQSRERLRLYALDFTPPNTSHKIVGGFVTVAGEDIVSPRSKIALESHDARAGVKDIRYRFKGKRGIYKNNLLTMDSLKDGIHSIVYAAEDRVGNSEDNKTFTFYLDSVPPVVDYSLLGDQYTKDKKTYVSGFTTVSLTATDNKAGVRRIRYYFPNKIAKTYTSPFGFPRKNGLFEFSYAASDNVINVSKKESRSVIVDITPPKVTPTFKGEHYFSRKTHYVRLTTEISLETKDNLSGTKSVSYAIDPASEVDPVLPYSTPFMLTTPGEHSLVYQAIDNVNNKTGADKVAFYVDEEPPENFHHFSVNATEPTTNTYPLKSLLYLAATDLQSGVHEIYYRINDGKETKYKNPLSFRKRTNYKVDIRSVDNVGNISSSSVNFEIR